MRKFDAFNFASDSSNRRSASFAVTSRRPPVTGALTSRDVGPIFSVVIVTRLFGSIDHVPVGCEDMEASCHPEKPKSATSTPGEGQMLRISGVLLGLLSAGLTSYAKEASPLDVRRQFFWDF
jgi:hypothetical protein